MAVGQPGFFQLEIRSGGIRRRREVAGRYHADDVLRSREMRTGRVISA